MTLPSSVINSKNTINNTINNAINGTLTMGSSSSFNNSNRLYEWILLFVLLLNHFLGFGPNVYTKASCALLFVYIGYMRLNSNNILTFIALIFAIIGDVLLALPNGFMMGGFSFLMCHVFYALTFITIFKRKFKSTREHIISLIIPIVASFIICYGYGYLLVVAKIQDRSYDVLVYPYLGVISTMTAISGAGENLLTKNYIVFFKNLFYKLIFRREPFSELELAYLRVIGASLFCLSDIFVARQQFLVQSPYNSIIGLPTYFIAQNIIAYSMQ